MIKRLRFGAFDKLDQASQLQDAIPCAETRTAHVVLRPETHDVIADVSVSVLPSRQGLYSFTLWSVALTAMLIVCSALMRVFDAQILGTIKIPSNSASIVLIAPAVLISWVGREQEHTLVALPLRPFRRILMLTVALLVSVAGLAAVPLAPNVWHWSWWTIYGGTLILVFSTFRVFRGYRKHPV